MSLTDEQRENLPAIATAEITRLEVENAQLHAEVADLQWRLSRAGEDAAINEGELLCIKEIVSKINEFGRPVPFDHPVPPITESVQGCFAEIYNALDRAEQELRHSE